MALPFAGEAARPIAISSFIFRLGAADGLASLLSPTGSRGPHPGGNTQGPTPSSSYSTKPERSPGAVSRGRRGPSAETGCCQSAGCRARRAPGPRRRKRRIPFSTDVTESSSRRRQRRALRPPSGAGGWTACPMPAGRCPSPAPTLRRTRAHGSIPASPERARKEG